MPYHGTDSDAVNEVLQRLGTIIGQTPQELQKKIVARLCDLLRSRAAAQIFIRLCKEKADTKHVLSKELDIPSRTVYYAIERLRRMGLVVEARPLGGARRAGAKASVYALVGYEPDSLTRAMKRDRLARSPVYAEVRRITQLLLEDYFSIITHGNTLNGRIYRAEVKQIVKRECRSLRFLDVLPLVEVELKKTGLAVL